MKRMIALVLSLVMALSLCAPAWGAVGSVGELPVASVEPYTPTEEIEWGNYGQWSPTPGLEANLEAIYKFACTETADEAAASPYADWYCDFYVKLDKDLGANQIFLGGNYGSFGWIGFHNGDVTLNANEELPLLGSVTSNPWTYADIASFVGEFICGVGDVDDALADATFTVMLRLTNPEDETEFYNVATINYTFKETAVAEVDGKTYKTLQEAVNVGGEVKLLEDISLTNTVKITADKTVSLDLNGKIIDGLEAVNIAIMSYGNLTLKDSSAAKTGAIKAGKTAADGKHSGNAVNICGGTFVMESGSLYSMNNAILIDEEAATVTIEGGKITAEPTTNNSAAFYISSTSDTVLNIEGGEMVGFNGILLWNNTTINMTGGSIDAQGRLGIQGNGSKDNTEINISGNAIVSGKEAAMYHPQGGKLNIKENAQLSGGTGLVVKGGTINISGGTISGNGAAAAYVPVSSGYESTGDGLYVEHYDNGGSENYGTPVVTVTGGKFSSVNGKAVASYANPNNDVEALTAFISGGYFNTDPSAYCVEGKTGIASDKAGYLYMVGVKNVETPAEVVVAAPTVSANTTGMSDTEKTIAETLTTTDNAVKLDESALTAKAADVANNTSAEATEDHAEELSAALTEAKGTDVTVAPAEVTVVVQPYFDVEIKDVVVEESGATVSSVTIELDITPMYQTVATTADVANDEKVILDDADSDKINAVVVGEAKPLKVTEPVVITIKIPASLVALATDSKLYVTHEASSGTYVYEATVDAVNNTATFTNPHGFSSFSISIVDDTVAEVGTDKYTNLQDAINNAGKDATITVVKGNNSATVKGETSFKVELKNGATVSITAAPGYKLSGPDADGVYTVTRVGGYYYPTTSDKLVESAKTADPVALYFGVTALATLGSALLLKKKED